MRAAVTQGVGKPLQLITLDDPTPGPGEVVVEVAGCGICGSDLHMSETFDIPGIVLGHEIAGTVAAVGTEVSDWEEGAAVAVLPTLGCGACPRCASGEPSKCTTMQLTGAQRPGGFAEYILTGADQLHALPDGFEQPGAVVEPLAVALHAVRKSGLSAGEPALVIGGGPVGAAVTLAAKVLGAGPVVVSDPVELRRRIAERVGAAGTIDPQAEDVRSAYEEIIGAPPQVVIECVGVPGLIQHCVDVADFDARITVVGVCMTDDSIFPLAALTKEVAMQFVLYYTTTDFSDTIRLIDDGRLDPTPLLTDEIGLEQLPERFEALRQPTTDCKVIVRPDLTGT